MARFPQAEAEIAALALRIIEGLESAAEDLPNPPVSAEELRGKLSTYNAEKKGAIESETETREHFVLKDDALEDMIDGMKANLRYAEIVFRNTPEKLRVVGWSAPRSGSTLEGPGEVRNLDVVAEGDGWLVLDWKQPVDGGPVAAYSVRRRRREQGSWEAVATAVETEALVSSQPRGVELEYQVVAVNKAGEGKPSASVTVVL